MPASRLLQCRVMLRMNTAESTILHYDTLGVKVQHVAPSNRHSESRTLVPNISDNIIFSIVHTPRSRLAKSGYGQANAESTGNAAV